MAVEMLSESDKDFLSEDILEGSEPMISGVEEECQGCEEYTEQEVYIEMVRENDAPGAVEPYRVSECQKCEEAYAVRMNNVS